MLEKFRRERQDGFNAQEIADQTRDLCVRLAASIDVFIENFVPGQTIPSGITTNVNSVEQNIKRLQSKNFATTVDSSLPVKLPTEDALKKLSELFQGAESLAIARPNPNSESYRKSFNMYLQLRGLFMPVAKSLDGISIDLVRLDFRKH